MDNASTMQSVADIHYLDDTNAEFHAENGFLSLTADIRVTEGDTSKTEKKHWERIFLHNAFPFDMPDSYISVLDDDQNEIGIIRSLDGLSSETRSILKAELLRKYYTPEITAILSVKERYGFSYWHVLLKDKKDFTFTVQDTYSSILKITPSHLFVLDVDGNRYEIKDAEALDHSSYKRIELYL